MVIRMAHTAYNFLTMEKDELSCNGPEIMDRLSLLSPRPDSDDWKTELLNKVLPKPEVLSPTNLNLEEPRVITIRNENARMDEDGWMRGHIGDPESPMAVPIQIENEEVPQLQESDEVIITELTLNVVDVPATMDGTWTLNTPTEPQSYPAWLVEGKQKPQSESVTFPKKKILKPKKLNVSLASNTVVTDLVNTPTLEDMIGDSLDNPNNNILKWVIDETIAPDEEFPGMLTEIVENPKPSLVLPKPKTKKRDMPWFVADPETKVRRKAMPAKLAEYAIDMPWMKAESEKASKEIKREMSTKLTEQILPSWMKKEETKDEAHVSTPEADQVTGPIDNDILIPIVDVFSQLGSNVSNDSNGEIVFKRKRGRPSKTTSPFITPKLPRQRRTKSAKKLSYSADHSYVTEEMRDDLKYRRMRDLNNEASRKCRINRKNKFTILLEEKDELILRNDELKEKVTDMEMQVADWKERVNRKAANIINSSEIASIDEGLAAVTSHDDVAALFYGSSIGPAISTMESTWSLNM